jgi:DNA-binding MarR family transcriptional regulator
VREVELGNRRTKRVSLTPAGRAVVERIDAIDDPAPPALAALAADDLLTLRAIIARVR